MAPTLGPRYLVPSSYPCCVLDVTRRSTFESHTPYLLQLSCLHKHFSVPSSMSPSLPTFQRMTRFGLFSRSLHLHLRRAPSAPVSLRSLSSASPSGSANPTPLYDFKTMATDNYNDVPRLRLPNLTDTMARYIETLLPITTRAEWEKNVVMVKFFLESKEGKWIQEKLEEVSKGEGYPYSYIEKYWDDM